MADLSARVEALEAENASLKAKVDALQARVESIEKGGRGKDASPKKTTGLRPKTAGARTGVSASAASLRTGGAAERKTGGRKKAAGPGKDLQKRLTKTTAVDYGDIPADRKGNYNIGKTNVYFVKPEKYVGESKTGAPSGSLKLAVARGFNGKEARGNLHYGKSGKIVYSIAGTGVVLDPASGEQTFFTEHNEDILSLAVHPTEPIVATGQLDPKGAGTPFICIWNENGELQKKITFHSRGIIALAFSQDGKYLASVGNDDNRELALWDWANQKDNAPLLVQNSSKDEVYGVSFAPEEKGEYNIAVTGAKLLKVITISGLPKKPTAKARAPSTFQQTKIVQKAYFQCHYGAGGVWYVGTADGHVYRMKGNDYDKMDAACKKKAASAMCACNEGFAVGCSDGTIAVYDADFKKIKTLEFGSTGNPGGAARSIAFKDGKFLVGTSRNQMYQVELESGKSTLLIDGHSGEAWGVSHSPTEALLVTCAEDKWVKFWDTSGNSLTSSAAIKMSDKARSCAFSPDGSLVAVGQWNGAVTIIDVASKAVKSSNKVADETVDCIAFNSDGSQIAAGSWDQMVYLIDTASGKPKAKMKGHTSSVLHIQWSDDDKFLMTSSRDYEYLFWNVDAKERVKKVQDVMDVGFSTWTNFLGWSVQGIWEGASDGTDINSVASSPDGTLLACGDDFGQVRLYAYPSLQEDAPRKDFSGHSSHVACVRWNKDGSSLFSAGGYDTAIFQWSKQ